MSLPHFIFVLPSEKMKCLIMCYLYFHYLKRNLNDELFKECINSLVLINSKCMLLFQLVSFKIYVIIKIFYFFNWSTKSSCSDMFVEININQKTFNLYTSLVDWKNQCRSTIRKHAMLWININFSIVLTYLLETFLTHFMALVSS